MTFSLMLITRNFESAPSPQPHQFIPSLQFLLRSEASSETILITRLNLFRWQNWASTRPAIAPARHVFRSPKGPVPVRIKVVR